MTKDAEFERENELERSLKTLRWPLFLTWAGLFAERVALAFWPLFSLVLCAIAFLFAGGQDFLPPVVLAGVFGSAALSAAGFGLYRLRIPKASEAVTRLDASLKGHPLKTLADSQVIGAQDAASVAVWAAHQRRAAATLEQARAVPADLRLSARDPLALRYVAAVFFAVSVLFGPVWPIGFFGQIADSSKALAQGPVWEGWIQPPEYTGKPTLYLNDQSDGILQVPQGSAITLRFYAEAGTLHLFETVSGQEKHLSSVKETHEFNVIQDGRVSIEGKNGRAWDVQMIADIAPEVRITSAAVPDARGVMSLPFIAEDDYAIVQGKAYISLDLPAIPRRHGLKVAPEERPVSTAVLPMPVIGDRSEFEEVLIEDFSQHPWVHLPVEVRLQVVDAAGQQSHSEPQKMLLPGRRFFDPMAAALIEQRRDLLWSRKNANRVAQILRAVSHRPADVFDKETQQLRLLRLIEKLERLTRFGRVTAQHQAEIAAGLWDLAVALEEGDLQDALARMRQAQERLNQALRDGASAAEIARLMQELRRANEDYLNQLHQKNAGEKAPDPENTLRMQQEDIQRMMDEIESLIEQGRMAEAAQALNELQEMIENMRVTPSDGRSGEGETSLDDLSDTLRRQQELNDQAFQDLQEQFSPNQRSQPSDEETRNDLARRQQALREDLKRQENALPDSENPEAGESKEALDRAGRAMEGAEEALRRGDLSQALDDQARAMEALREGLQSLADSLAENGATPDSGAQGVPNGPQGGSMDPLGRQPNGARNAEGNEDRIPEADVYRRAGDLLAEIRRRSAQGERPLKELDYLKRLLERF